jgi:hypothetical protein
MKFLGAVLEKNKGEGKREKQLGEMFKVQKITEKLQYNRRIKFYCNIKENGTK